MESVDRRRLPARGRASRPRLTAPGANQSAASERNAKGQRGSRVVRTGRRCSPGAAVVRDPQTTARAPGRGRLRGLDPELTFFGPL